jgi:hypothetical protein
LMEKDDVYSRGISICSYSDNPNKKIGRKTARDRAYKATFNKRSLEPICLDTKTIFENNLYPKEFFVFQYKSEYYVKLTDFEKKIYKIGE